MMKNDTAILLFSRTATAEAAAKPLSIGKSSAKSIASFLINHAKKLAAKTQLPLFFISEKQQRGNTFGERFANAFEDVFALGFDRIISIGNDCLTLSKKDILTAADLLTTTPSVLGVTDDGGAYLIGLHKSVFQKNDFQNIHWQTGTTFLEIVQFVEKQAFDTAFMSKKADIDSVSDWKAILRQVSTCIRKILLSILNKVTSAPSAYAIFPLNQLFLKACQSLRAPPFSYQNI